jgi:hypothetical protein
VQLSNVLLTARSATSVGGVKVAERQLVLASIIDAIRDVGHLGHCFWGNHNDRLFRAQVLTRVTSRQHALRVSSGWIAKGKIHLCCLSFSRIHDIFAAS